VAETPGDVVVDHARGLHVRVDDGAADELEAARFEVLAEPVGFPGGRRNVGVLPETVLDGPAVDEAPDIVAEGSELVPDLEECPGVTDGRLDLEPIPYDPGVLQNLVDPLIRKAGNLLGVEVSEQPTVAVTLVEDRRPAQPGLRALEDQEFELSM